MQNTMGPNILDDLKRGDYDNYINTIITGNNKGRRHSYFVKGHHGKNSDFHLLTSELKILCNPGFLTEDDDQEFGNYARHKLQEKKDLLVLPEKSKADPNLMEKYLRLVLQPELLIKIVLKRMRQVEGRKAKLSYAENFYLKRRVSELETMLCEGQVNQEIMKSISSDSTITTQHTFPKVNSTTSTEETSKSYGGMELSYDTIVKTGKNSQDKEPQNDRSEYFFPGVEIPWFEGCVYKCNHCGIYFWSLGKMQQHMNKDHDRVYGNNVRYKNCTLIKARYWECIFCHQKMMKTRYYITNHIKKLHRGGKINLDYYATEDSLLVTSSCGKKLNKSPISITIPKPKRVKMTSKHPKSKDKTSSHPPYIDMVKTAIASLKSRKGSSRQAILNYITSNFEVGNDKKFIRIHVKAALRRYSAKGHLVQQRDKTVGASGSFKLAKKLKLPSNNDKAREKKKSNEPRGRHKDNKDLMSKKGPEESKKSKLAVETNGSEDDDEPFDIDAIIAMESDEDEESSLIVQAHSEPTPPTIVDSWSSVKKEMEDEDDGFTLSDDEEGGENIISSDEEDDPKPQSLNMAQSHASSTSSIVSSFLERTIKQDSNIKDEVAINPKGNEKPNKAPNPEVEAVETLKRSLGIDEDKSFRLLSEEDKAQVGIRLEKILSQVSDGATFELVKMTLSRYYSDKA